MDLKQIFAGYPNFIESTLFNRLFSHREVTALLGKLPSAFKVEEIGRSEENRSIHCVKFGNGPCKVMLWSQMHGHEPTGTMALFDLVNFLQHPDHSPVSNKISEACTLFMIPMVNPDGAEIHERRNSQQIDINRDFLAEHTAEGRLLKKTRAEIKPAFGFNLHDQITLWSINKTYLPATLSYLAPAIDNELSIDDTREKAMKVIADMFDGLTDFLPGQIGLFDDTFEPRAFGDNFQISGTSTILIEAGGLGEDPEKQEIRKYFFMSMLAGLNSISKGTYKQQTTEHYFSIPANDKKLFHLIIHNVNIDGLNCSLSLNYDEVFDPGQRTLNKVWTVHDKGDLRGWNAYETYDNGPYNATGVVKIDMPANMEIFKDGKVILGFIEGVRR
ncbi:MAG: carboxypeptidase [Sphingobacteriales bacterium]|nr:MAG: carboxypeptidase [Sphingobacteriales bacterium]